MSDSLVVRVPLAGEREDIALTVTSGERSLAGLTNLEAQEIGFLIRDSVSVLLESETS